MHVYIMGAHDMWVAQRSLPPVTHGGTFPVRHALEFILHNHPTTDDVDFASRVALGRLLGVLEVKLVALGRNSRNLGLVFSPNCVECWPQSNVPSSLSQCLSLSVVRVVAVAVDVVGQSQSATYFSHFQSN